MNIDVSKSKASNISIRYGSVDDVDLINPDTFSTSYIMVFWFFVVVVFSEFKREVIFRFIDNGGIDDHHCVNLLFMTHDLS